MKINTYAKINLNLKISKAVEDGLHNISSLMVPINLYDSIEIKETNADVDEIQFDKEGISEENTISKSLNLLRSRSNLPGFFHIIIEKNIPIEAGLGGGSSNAAGIISILTKKYNLQMPTYREIAVNVGSDVPFFITGKPANILGIGDIVNPENLQRDINMILVVPNEKISTRHAFSMFDKLSQENLEINEYEDLKIFNDFWIPAQTLEPNLLKIKNNLESITNLEFYLSGSGSSMFSLGDTEELTKKIDLIDLNQFKLVKLVKKIDFSFETISD
ncbi:4-(cytidine 5'-diphospho)-2-C-methyl-D-erythritol kinase [Acidimicrobiaceae bacterium]|nr:4-(cytidine 5'-diphospho)-2-C-methyl-D-erythritol kinase [Acidimicrobiaceae bacterium]